MTKEMNPRMHTAEHLLNQTMVRVYHCNRCFSAHIEKKKSKCDYHFDHALTGDEVRDIESRINEIIEADIPVREEFLPREEAERLYDLERLPEVAGNDIRVIKTGDYDACPCIGPHARSTKTIGNFKITSTSFNNNVLRIRFKLSQS